MVDWRPQTLYDGRTVGGGRSVRKTGRSSLWEELWGEGALWYTGLSDIIVMLCIVQLCIFIWVCSSTVQLSAWERSLFVCCIQHRFCAEACSFTKVVREFYLPVFVCSCLCVFCLCLHVCVFVCVFVCVSFLCLYLSVWTIVFVCVYVFEFVWFLVFVCLCVCVQVQVRETGEAPPFGLARKAHHTQGPDIDNSAPQKWKYQSLELYQDKPLN